MRKHDQRSKEKFLRQEMTHLDYTCKFSAGTDKPEHSATLRLGKRIGFGARSCAYKAMLVKDGADADDKDKERLGVARVEIDSWPELWFKKNKEKWDGTQERDNLHKNAAELCRQKSLASVDKVQIHAWGYVNVGKHNHMSRTHLERSGGFRTSFIS